MNRLLLVITILLLAGIAEADSFTTIRIGDVDGFGFGVGSGLTNAEGRPVNVDGVGVLGGSDYLPDLNGSGYVATRNGDDFDNRSAAEKLGDYFQIVGAATVNSVTGSDFTDISLSTSFTGPDFPAPPAGTLPNQPGFVFDFIVAAGDINTSSDVFFNMVFGDYDVYPATIRVTSATGATFTLPISLQAGADDGLIQAKFATLSFSDVFTLSGGSYSGYLEVDFDADQEPYTAFDYVELSMNPIPPVAPQSHAVPLPAAAWTGLGLLGLLGVARRMRRNRGG